MKFVGSVLLVLAGAAAYVGDRAIIAWLRGLFACRHARISRVFTHPDTGLTYVVCMGCCQRHLYDWSRMELGARIEPPRPRLWNDGLETRS